MGKLRLNWAFILGAISGIAVVLLMPWLIHTQMQRELADRIEVYRGDISHFEFVLDCAEMFTENEDHPLSLRTAWELAEANYREFYPDMAWEREWPQNPYTGEPVRQAGYTRDECYGDVLYIPHIIEFSEECAVVTDYTLVELYRPEPGMEPGIYWRFGDICCDIEVMAIGLSPAEVLDSFLEPTVHRRLEEVYIEDPIASIADGRWHCAFMIHDELEGFMPDRQRYAFVKSEGGPDRWNK